MKKLLLSAGFLMAMLIPTKAKAEYGYSYPSYGGYSMPSYGYASPSYSSLPSYGNYGYAQPTGYRYSVSVTARYTPSYSNYGFGSCGMSYGGCGSYGGFAMSAYGSHGMAGYGGYGMMGYGMGHAYGGRHMGCASRHHMHRGHRCGGRRRCCGRNRRYRSFALNIGFGGFRLGIRSRSW